MPISRDGAKGEMQLRQVFREESSGYNDATEELVQLQATPDGASLTLIETMTHSPTMGSDTKQERRTVIAVDRLIDLIQKNGQKVP
jgi:hypothetical protein